MKILFVFTGGTIGSTRQGDYIGIDGGKPYVLLEQYRAVHGVDFLYDTITPYTALSEHNTGDTLRLLCGAVREALDGSYDGVVVTHGTDTLQYSAAALAYTLADVKIPVVLVSSNKPIEEENANGIANLHGAIRFIREVGTAGVFVSYQNKGERVKIHRGTRLLASPAFSDGVYSVCDCIYGYFPTDGAFCKNPAYHELPNALLPLCADNFAANCDEICHVTAYPGNPYPDLSPQVKYVLHSSYHSGTLNTASPTAVAFFEKMRKQGVSVFLTGVAGGVSYESTREFQALGICPLVGLAPIAAFIKLWLLSAQSPNTPVSAKMLLSPLGGDIVLP